MRDKSALVVVAVVAVDLAANFATGPQRAVDVDVSGARAHRFDQFVDLARVESLSSERRQSPEYSGLTSAAKIVPEIVAGGAGQG